MSVGTSYVSSFRSVVLSQTVTLVPVSTWITIGCMGVGPGPDGQNVPANPKLESRTKKHTPAPASPPRMRQHRAHNIKSFRRLPRAGTRPILNCPLGFPGFRSSPDRADVRGCHGTKNPHY